MLVLSWVILLVLLDDLFKFVLDDDLTVCFLSVIVELGFCWFTVTELFFVDDDDPTLLERGGETVFDIEPTLMGRVDGTVGLIATNFA